MQASELGYHEFDALLPDLSPNATEAMREGCAKYKKRGEILLNEERLTKRQEHYLNELLAEVNYCVQGYEFNTHLLPPLSPKYGVQIDLSSRFKRAATFRLKEEEDVENALKRLAAIPEYLKQVRELLDEGVKQNVTFPKETLELTQAQFRNMQMPPRDSPFFTPFSKERLDKINLSQAKIEAFQNRAEDLIENKTLPAFKSLQTFLYGPYQEHLRSKPGFVALPNGKKIYESCLKYQTTIPTASPERVHELGLKEMERLKAGVRTVAKDLGLGHLDNKALVEHVRAIPEQTYNSSEHMIGETKELIKDVITPAMAALFEEKWLTSPKMEALDVEAFDKGRPGVAYYKAPTGEGEKKRGLYRVNTEAVKAFQLRTLTLHEAVPGHHFQLGVVGNSIQDQPKFLTNPIFFPMESCPRGIPTRVAYSEGWGLYSEYLGQEMELYTDPLDKFGFYTYNLLRAARLVVDTGIHYYGWSYQKAFDYLVEEALVEPVVARPQLIRYITRPGQATGYKLGELEILRMRREREEKLGSDFDLKKFHTHYLSCTGVMKSVEKCIVEMEKE